MSLGDPLWGKTHASAQLGLGASVPRLNRVIVTSSIARTGIANDAGGEFTKHLWRKECKAVSQERHDHPHHLLHIACLSAGHWTRGNRRTSLHRSELLDPALAATAQCPMETKIADNLLHRVIPRSR